MTHRIMSECFFTTELHLAPTSRGILAGMRNGSVSSLTSTTLCDMTFQVTDMMLQEKLYPGWAVRVRAWWVRRYHRIILFWVVTLVTSFVVIFTISTDYISWDKLNHDFLPTNELSRSFLASFILVFDIMIVMQVNKQY